MGLSEDQKLTLKLFANLSLNREQTERLLDCTLTEREWKSLNFNRKEFTHISKEAAAKGKQRIVRNLLNENSAICKTNRQFLKEQNESLQDDYTYIKSLHKRHTNTYSINLLRNYYSNKFKTNITDWKITGERNLFNVNKAIKDLINKIVHK